MAFTISDRKYAGYLQKVIVIVIMGQPFGCSVQLGRLPAICRNWREHMVINTRIVYNELHVLTMELFINRGGCNEEERE